VPPLASVIAPALTGRCEKRAVGSRRVRPHPLPRRPPVYDPRPKAHAGPDHLRRGAIPVPRPCRRFFRPKTDSSCAPCDFHGPPQLPPIRALGKRKGRGAQNSSGIWLRSSVVQKLHRDFLITFLAYSSLAFNSFSARPSTKWQIMCAGYPRSASDRVAARGADTNTASTGTSSNAEVAPCSVWGRTGPILRVGHLLEAHSGLHNLPHSRKSVLQGKNLRPHTAQVSHWAEPRLME